MTDETTEAVLEQEAEAEGVLAEQAAAGGELEPREQGRIFDPKVVQIAVKLEEAGAITPVSFDLDANVPIEKWMAVGGYFGALNKASRFWLGDWLNWGQLVYGEAAFQATEEGVDFTPAESTTGLAGSYLRELARVCEHVAKDRRRPELTFGHHREVYHLEPDQQTRWLEAAIENDWTRDQLRREIRQDGGGQEPLEPAQPARSQSEVLAEAAALVWHQAQKDPDGFWRVQDEHMKQLGSALGELD